MKLYELSAEMKIIEKKMMAYAAENDGDMEGFPGLQAFDTLSGDIETKALNGAVYVKNKLALAEAIKGEIGVLTKRKNAALNVAKYFTGYLSHFVEVGAEYENARAQIKWNKGNKLVIPADVEIKDVGDEYIRVQKEFKRSEIKKAVIAGKIDWASIDKSRILKIK